MTTRVRYSPEVRERAVRMVFEHEGAHGSQRAAIRSISEKIGCSGETLRNWVRPVERDEGRCPGLTTEERGRLKEQGEIAEKENISANQFVTLAVAEKISALAIADYLQPRAARAPSRERFQEILAKVPSVEPDPEDRID